MQRKRTEIRIGAPPGSPVLSDYMACRDRVSLIMGPLGSGKTIGSIQRLLKQMTEQEPNGDGIRPTRWGVVRNTYVDLAGTTMKDFESIFDHTMGFWKRGSIEPPTFYSKLRLPDGTRADAEFVFMALDKPKDVKKLRGFQATGAWLNEVKELDKATVDMMDGRIGRYPSMASGGVRASWWGMLGDTNACDTEHWYWNLAEKVHPSGWTFFRQPGGVRELPRQRGDMKRSFEANPAAENLTNLPPGYYMNQVESKDPAWVLVNLGNEYGFYIEGKPVHSGYVDSTHCPGKLAIADAPLYIGVDFGRTPAAAICQVDEPVDRKLAVDEFLGDDIPASIFGPELKLYLQKKYGSRYGGLRLRGWCDPAGGKPGQSVDTAPIDILRAAGLPVEPAQTNNVAARRASVAVPLRALCIDGQPRLLISSKCTRLRKGMMGGFCYRRVQVSGEKYTEEPDKNMYSHVCEGLEYAMMGLGEYHQALKGAAAQAGQRRGVRGRPAARQAITPQ